MFTRSEITKAMDQRRWTASMTFSVAVSLLCCSATFADPGESWIGLGRGSGQQLQIQLRLDHLASKKDGEIVLQGQVLDQNNEVVTGKLRGRFVLYADEAGQRPLLSEVHDIDPQDGFFNVRLERPSATAKKESEAFSPLYLELAVGTEVMTPRFQIERGFIQDTEELPNRQGIELADVESGTPIGLKSSTYVYRGQIPIWLRETTVTDNIGWTPITTAGICIGCYPQLASVNGSLRRQYRFSVLYTDTQSSCGYYSYWRLSRHDNPDIRYLDWSLPRTWSGNGLWHMRTSQFFDASALSNCDASWSDGTCSIWAKLNYACTGHSLKVAGIFLEYYDVVP
jgi:hypothetical protein